MLIDLIPADVAFFGSWRRWLEPSWCKPPLPGGLPLEPPGMQPPSTIVIYQLQHRQVQNAFLLILLGHILGLNITRF